MFEVGAIGAEEGGIVGKAAGNAGGGGTLSALEHGLCGKQTLYGDILPQRRAGSLTENTAYLAAAAVEGVGNGLQGNILKKMLVDIGNQLSLKAVVSRVGLAGAAVILGVEKGQKKLQTGHEVQADIAYSVKVKAHKGCLQTLLSPIEVMLSQRTVKERFQKALPSRDRLLYGGRKMQGYPLIGLFGADVYLMSFRCAHYQYITGLELILAALDQITALSGDKIEYLHPLMGMHLKTVRKRYFINGMMAVYLVITIAENVSHTATSLAFLPVYHSMLLFAIIFGTNCNSIAICTIVK